MEFSTSVFALLCTLLLASSLAILPDKDLSELLSNLDINDEEEEELVQSSTTEVVSRLRELYFSRSSHSHLSAEELVFQHYDEVIAFAYEYDRLLGELPVLFDLVRFIMDSSFTYSLRGPAFVWTFMYDREIRGWTLSHAPIMPDDVCRTTDDKLEDPKAGPSSATQQCIARTTINTRTTKNLVHDKMKQADHIISEAVLRKIHNMEVLCFQDAVEIRYKWVKKIINDNSLKIIAGRVWLRDHVFDPDALPMRPDDKIEEVVRESIRYGKWEEAAAWPPGNIMLTTGERRVFDPSAREWEFEFDARPLLGDEKYDDFLKTYLDIRRFLQRYKNVVSAKSPEFDEMCKASYEVNQSLKELFEKYKEQTNVPRSKMGLRTLRPDEYKFFNFKKKAKQPTSEFAYIIGRQEKLRSEEEILREFFDRNPSLRRKKRTIPSPPFSRQKWSTAVFSFLRNGGLKNVSNVEYWLCEYIRLNRPYTFSDFLYLQCRANKCTTDIAQLLVSRQNDDDDRIARWTTLFSKLRKNSSNFPALMSNCNVSDIESYKKEFRAQQCYDNFYNFVLSKRPWNATLSTTTTTTESWEAIQRQQDKAMLCHSALMLMAHVGTLIWNYWDTCPKFRYGLLGPQERPISLSQVLGHKTTMKNREVAATASEKDEQLCAVCNACRRTNSYKPFDYELFCKIVEKYPLHPDSPWKPCIENNC